MQFFSSKRSRLIGGVCTDGGKIDHHLFSSQQIRETAKATTTLPVKIARQKN
jgi:hypothetical protein